MTVYNGEITKLDLKSYEYNDNLVEYYLATLKASKIGPQIKRKSDYRDEDVKVVNRAVVRISDNTCENLNLQVGDKISLNGGVVDDKFSGAMIKRSTIVLKV